MKMLYLLASINLLILLNSCSEEGSLSSNNPTKKNSVKTELDQFVNSQQNPTPDLSSFMDSGVAAVTIDSKDGAAAVPSTPSKESTQEPNLEDSTSKTDLSQIKESVSLNQSDDELIAELRSVISNKDRKIQQLILENESLLLRLQQKQISTQNTASVDPVNKNFLDFRNEISVVQADLNSQSSEFAELQSQKQILEQRINSYESKSEILSPDSGSNKYSVLPLKNLNSQNYITEDVMKNCGLSFDAVVTLQNGKSKEAIYTEFFLIDRNFGQILQDGSIFLSDYSSVSSFEELWAQSRKTPFRFPGLNKKIRSLLQNEVSQGRGYRVRTNLDGSASFENLPARSFNLIGTASLGIVGVTWNLSVRLMEGANNLSLTLANASWSK